jgi:hypothetical protein
MKEVTSLYLCLSHSLDISTALLCMNLQCKQALYTSCLYLYLEREFSLQRYFLQLIA